METFQKGAVGYDRVAARDDSGNFEGSRAQVFFFFSICFSPFFINIETRTDAEREREREREREMVGNRVFPHCRTATESKKKTGEKERRRNSWRLGKRKNKNQRKFFFFFNQIKSKGRPYTWRAATFRRRVSPPQKKKFKEFLWTRLASIGFYWVFAEELPSFAVYFCFFGGLTMFDQDYWVLLGFTGFYWV